MKRSLLGILALAGVVTFASPSSAQRRPAPAAPAPTAGRAAGGPGGNVEYKQKTVYDFDDDTVEGDLVRPDGEFVDTRKAAKHSSLIKIRPDFIPEMLKSAEDI